jgi:hypothetical protein
LGVHGRVPLRIEYDLVPEDWGEFAAFWAQESPSTKRSVWTSRIGVSATLVLALIAASLSACSSPGPITAVTVRDSNFQIVKQLSTAELAEFEHRWNAKTKVSTSLKDAGGEHFKLDIASEGTGNRWLYHTTGYVQVLSISVLGTPVYQVPEPEAFNKLIGVRK